MEIGELSLKIFTCSWTASFLCALTYLSVAILESSWMNVLRWKRHVCSYACLVLWRAFAAVQHMDVCTQLAGKRYMCISFSGLEMLLMMITFANALREYSQGEIRLSNQAHLGTQPFSFTMLLNRSSWPRSARPLTVYIHSTKPASTRDATWPSRYASPGKWKFLRGTLFPVGIYKPLTYIYRDH